MKRFVLPLLLALASTAFAQELKPLTIGDPAPAFPVDGFIKGEKVSKLEKGKMYIVEFWATWCGPCIAVFPHLSDLTAKYEGQVTTVSVNTWDYRGDADKDAHVKRVNEFVEKQGDKMAYNIVLDDDKDTISTTWMRAAGRNGIPCAFIVNEEGLIAWIGHPASMDKPLEQIVAKTWDLQAFKKQFDAEAAKAREAAALQAEVLKISKAGDMDAFDKIVEKMGAQQALYAAINGEANFAVRVLEKYAGKTEIVDHGTVCSMAAYLVGKKEMTSESKEKVAKMSEACAGMEAESKQALAAAYHARVLFGMGQKDAAMEWITKAEALADKYEPKAQQASIKKFIADTKKSFGA
ncbi:MAG: TlpA family protein disulfide reductase [Armatimonadetes bacterium]|nr:TlpA family protein disulfide reductase [Armatimonadota bacterium]